MSFNLIEEAWIPVVLTDGSPGDLSLRSVFERSGEIRKVSADLPTQSFAIVRLLLAIHHDAVGFHSETDVENLLRNGIDQEAIARYFGTYSDRFDLFHTIRPFMQVATLRTAKDEASGLEKLISDVPNGSPFMTTRGGDSLLRIPPAEAALWLVHAQAFDASGIRSGAVGDPLASGGRGYPIGPSWAGQIGGVILHGETLERTLIYNTVPTPGDPLDKPAWAQEEPQTEQREMDPTGVGPVSLLAWQSRRIRLVGDSDGVTGIVLAQGDKMTPQNRQTVEHMTAWRFSTPQTKKFGIPVYMPRKHDPNRAGWRGMPGLVSDAAPTKEGHPGSIRPENVKSVARHALKFEELGTQVVLELVGMEYGPQEATIADIVHDTLDLRLSVLGEDAVEIHLMLFDIVETADQAVFALGRLASNISSAAGDFEGLDGSAERAKSTGWTALDAPARDWLATLTADTDTIEARREWQALVRGVLEPIGASLVRASSPAGVTGRKTKFGFMTTAKAENFFRHALRKELPLAYPKPTEREDTDEQ